MYWDYAGCEKYASGNPAKPLIQCEYAHAMGNSLGGFKEYWDLTRKYPSFQGGFIWDFVDQAQRIKRNGVWIYAYGGDFNPYDAHDFNFCNNGLINPDRLPNPHMDEAGYWQQPVWTTDEGIAEGRIGVFNEYFFRSLSNYRMHWNITCDGIEIKSGTVDDLDIGPQQRAEFALLSATADLPAGGELFLNVEYRLETAEPLLPAGFRIARQQLPIRGYRFPEAGLANRTLDRHTTAGTVAVKENDRNFLIVEGENFHVDFSRRNGLITRYEAGGMSFLADGAALAPNFWRAPTDNDFGANLQVKNAVWRNPAMKLVSLGNEMRDGMAVVTASYDLTDVSGRLTIEYTLNNTGEIAVRQTLDAASGGNVPDMLRFGMRMAMPGDFDRVNYYGRGPIENYADRKLSQAVGLYRQSVDEQFYPYDRPQETGTKSDIRWWHQCDMGGRGLRITSPEAFSASALHYSQESLDEGLEKKHAHPAEVPKDSRVWLCIDKAQYGLGCINSWGAHTLPENRLPYGNYSFEFTISPAAMLF